MSMCLRNRTDMVTLGRTERVPEKGASGREQEPVVCAAMLACLVMHRASPLLRLRERPSME